LCFNHRFLTLHLRRDIAIVGKKSFPWLLACSNAVFAPKDPRSAMSHISSPMLDRKVISPTCTNFKFAVIKRVLPVMSLQLMTDGTSNMVLANFCLNVCFKRNLRRATREADPQLSVTSRTILTSTTMKQGSQLHPIDIQLSRHASCIKPERRKNWTRRALIWIQMMIVTTTRVQQGKEGEPHFYACTLLS
jgi:hypothetical protein